jgi:hypothetical protein
MKILLFELRAAKRRHGLVTRGGGHHPFRHHDYFTTPPAVLAGPVQSPSGTRAYALPTHALSYASTAFMDQQSGQKSFSKRLPTALRVQV